MIPSRTPVTIPAARWRDVVSRQLSLLFVIGCTIALAAEGRVTPWLTLDGMISGAFIPLFQLLAFLVIWRFRIRGVRADADRARAYLETNAPWFWWWCVLAAIVSVSEPRSMGPWIVTSILMSSVVLFSWTALRDVRWLRAQGRSTRDATMDVAALRIAGWGVSVVWFFGIAIWYGEVPKLLAMWQR